MPIVRRGAPLVLVRRRGMGQNTLATGANAAQICASRGSVLSAAGNCVTPDVASAADIANQNQLLSTLPTSALSAASVAACAPPVYVSSWTPSSTPSDWGSPSYALNNQAQGTAGQVNAQNARLYQGWQTALLNWQMQGSKGPPPPCPTYVTFNQYWSTMNLGPAPATISTAPPGTPLPAGTILTGALAPGGAGYPLSGPQATLPYPKQSSAPAPVQSNAPAPQLVVSPASNTPSPQAQSNAPSPTVAPPSTGFLATLQNIASQVTGGGAATGTASTSGNWFDGIPNWAVLAAAGVGVFLLWPRGRR